MERLTTPSNRQQVRGFLTIHSTPSALRHHIDWAIQAVLGTLVKPTWTSQPLTPGSYRTQIEFRDRQGAAYDDFLATGDDQFKAQLPHDEWQSICLNYTSGTTGDPKGVVYHLSLHCN